MRVCTPPESGQRAAAGNPRATYLEDHSACEPTVVNVAGVEAAGDESQYIHDWLDEYDKKTGLSIPMHIEGASGGVALTLDKSVN